MIFDWLFVWSVAWPLINLYNSWNSPPGNNNRTFAWLSLGLGCLVVGLSHTAILILRASILKNLAPCLLFLTPSVEEYMEIMELDTTTTQCTDGEGECALTSMPLEVLLHIFSFLSHTDLHKAALTCKAVNALASEPVITIYCPYSNTMWCSHVLLLCQVLWRGLALRNLNVPPGALEGSKFSSWSHLYMRLGTYRGWIE